ncbi:MAG: ABC transporter substrate-binding protein [Treponema sp.]|jgi:iron complex transport system substrate-binding protein|nr:ABC transporter substrate-binding protein [Treponema sp.]
MTVKIKKSFVKALPRGSFILLCLFLVFPALAFCGKGEKRAAGENGVNGNGAGGNAASGKAGNNTGAVPVERPELYWTIVQEGGTGFVRDKNGFSVPLRTYERIVLISPGAVESFYLIGAEDRIAAVSSSRDPVWPEEKTALLPSIGNAARPNMEAIVALEPDLVIGNAMSVSLAADLASRGYAVLVHGADSMAEIFNNTRIIGRFTGKDDAAERLIQEKEGRLENLRRELAERPLTYKGTPLKGAFLYSTSPIMAFTESSLPGEILSILGLANIAAGLNAAQPILSPEYILAQDPDFLFGSMAITKAEDILGADSVILQTRAGRERNIRFVPSSLFLRTSPRIVEGLLDMYGELAGFSDR